MSQARQLWIVCGKANVLEPRLARIWIRTTFVVVRQPQRDVIPLDHTTLIVWCALIGSLDGEMGVWLLDGQTLNMKITFKCVAFDCFYMLDRVIMYATLSYLPMDYLPMRTGWGPKPFPLTGSSCLARSL